jgi:hypothetical protein
MAYGTVLADQIQSSVSGVSLGAGNASIMKNRIINGAMVIDQRNAGASVTVTNTGAATYVLDRWNGYGNVASKFSIQQNAGSVTPPAGFTNYLGVTSLSAYSIGSTDQFQIGQPIEGFNTADLGWGTANAKTVTLSFWVRSSLTGTFGGALRNSAGDRSYPFSYSIPSANTWTQISITIAGDTSGTWVGSTNGLGILLIFGLGIGSTYSGTAGSWAGALYGSSTGATSVVGTNGATFYITGVQLEVGSSATGFEYRQYGQELALCQRYFASFGFGSVGAAYASTALQVGSKLPMTMRAAPTLTITTTSPTFSFPAVGDKTGSGSTINYQQASLNGIRANVDGLSGLTANYVGISATDVFFASAEL